MTRAYLRLDPEFFERRLERGDPPGAFATYIAVLCLAESQPKRGRFRDVSVLKALLTPRFARWVSYLVERGDLIQQGNRLYVEGWDEWQEGDWKVAERVSRIRSRTHGATNGVTGPTVTATVTPTVSVRNIAVEAEAEAVSGGGKRRRRQDPTAGPIPIDEVLRDE